MPLQNIIQIFQTIKKSLGAQVFGLVIKWSVKEKRTRQELSFMHVTLLLDLIYVPSKYHHFFFRQYVSYSLHKISAQGELVHIKK